MGYDATGVASDGRAYAVVLRAVAESDSEVGSDWVGKVRYIRLIMEDPFKGPCPTSYDSLKIRTDCQINGDLSRGELEAFLASGTDGMKLPEAAISDVLRIVFEGADTRPAARGFYLWVDIFTPGRGNKVEYWFDDDLEYEGGSSDDEDEEDGPAKTHVLIGLKREDITEEGQEAGCELCGEEKAEVGSEFMWMPCGHSFHGGCLCKWTVYHCYCPTCNYRLPVQDYKDYPCVCNHCLYRRDIDHNALPDHPPPYLKFY